MKTTVISQDGNMEIVLTPENEFEKDIMDKYAKRATEIQYFKGNFEDCRGGWTRNYNNTDSFMIKIQDNKGDKANEN